MVNDGVDDVGRGGVVNEASSEIDIDSAASALHDSPSESVSGFEDDVLDVSRSELIGSTYSCGSCADDNDLVDGLKMS